MERRQPDPVVAPIYQSTTFRLDDAAYADIREHGGLNEYWYTRFGNPTVAAAAATIAELEGAEAAAMTSSGMAAIATTLMTLLKQGDRLVVSRELYGDTRDLLVRDLPRLGYEVEFVAAADLDAWRAAFTRPAAVAFAESISNPQLVLLDIPSVAAIAHEAGARLVVDNTFASPYLIRPLLFGADVVVESATKFLNGHSDVVAGVIAADEPTVRDARKLIVTFGASLDPHAAFLVSRGMKTFELRLERQTATAKELAELLAFEEEVAAVIHPSLESYPYSDVAREVLGLAPASAVVTFVVRGGNDRALRVVRKLRVATEATSLGGVETLASLPFNSSHFMFSEDELAAAGIVDGMIRLSVGLEPVRVLIEDIRDALLATQAVAGRT